MKRVVNLQAHLLPGLELGVGPNTLAESVHMVKDLAAIGMTDIYCTPKVNDSNLISVVAAMNLSLSHLKQAIQEQAISVTLYGGAVVELSDTMIEYIEHHRDVLVLENSHFMLVSFPEMSKVYHIDSWLKALQDLGITPIISEAEMHPALFNDPDHIIKWVDSGILVECNVQSLSRESRHFKRALDLYRNGLIHFLGTGYNSSHTIHHTYVETIAQLDTEYKKDLLGAVQLNERDLLADRVFYPPVPNHWQGGRPNFWTRLFNFAL